MNWQPIRQPGRLEGSVWEKVHAQIRARGSGELSNKDERDELNRAFMRPANAKCRSTSPCSRGPRRRLLAAKESFTADVLYSHLARVGFANPTSLAWALGAPVRRPPARSTTPTPTGSRSKSSSSLEVPVPVVPRLALHEVQTVSDSPVFAAALSESWTDASSESDSDSGTESSGGSSSCLSSSCSAPSTPAAGEDCAAREQTLEALVGLLQAAGPAEEVLRDEAGRLEKEQLVATDDFLVKLTSLAPLSVLLWRVNAVGAVLRFPTEAAYLRTQLMQCIDVCETVVKSTAFPMLLEGVLVMGNYVNAGSVTLGKAVAVTLDSLAKLMHTKCGAVGEAPKPGVANAFSLLVQQQEESRGPHFRSLLVAELQKCRAAKDCEPAFFEEGVKRLDAQVAELEEKMKSSCTSPPGTGEPAVLKAKHLELFLSTARPEVEELRAMVDHLKQASERFRAYFCEPPTSSLPRMLKILASLLDAMPLAAAAGQDRAARRQPRPKNVPPLRLNAPKVPPLPLGKVSGASSSKGPSTNSSTSSSAVAAAARAALEYQTEKLASPPGAKSSPRAAKGASTPSPRAAPPKSPLAAVPQDAALSPLEPLSPAAGLPAAGSAPDADAGAALGAAAAAAAAIRLAAKRRGTPATPRDAHCGELATHGTPRGSPEDSAKEVAASLYYVPATEPKDGLESWQGPAPLTTPIKEEPSESDGVSDDRSTARSDATTVVSVMTPPRSGAPSQQSFYGPARPTATSSPCAAVTGRSCGGVPSSPIAFTARSTLDDEVGDSIAALDSRQSLGSAVSSTSARTPDSQSWSPLCSSASGVTPSQQACQHLPLGSPLPMAKLSLASLNLKALPTELTSTASTTDRTIFSSARTDILWSGGSSGSGPPTDREPGLTKVFGLMIFTPRSSATSPRAR